MEEKKLFFICVENNQVKYKMVDEKSDFHGVFYKKANCFDLVLESKTLVPMDDNTKRYGYRYKYKFVPKADSKFIRYELIDKRRLIGEYIYETIEEKPKEL